MNDNFTPFLRLKKYPEDFFVEEILPDETTSIQDLGEQYIRIKIEKRDTNTMDIVHGLIKEFGRTRKQIGVSGLKDKNAVTRQWISIDSSLLREKSSINAIEQFLKNHNSSLITRTGKSYPLHRSYHIANAFTIKARPIRALQTEQIDQIEKNLHCIKKNGFSNLFGRQRFGKQQRNYKRAVAILDEYMKNPVDSYQQLFALQAYPAYRFNILAQSRTPGEVLPGDMLVETTHGTFPTGIMLGSQLQYTAQGTTQWELEEKIITESNRNNYLPGLTNFGIIGRRRPLWVKPLGLEWERTEQYLSVSFTLPPGSYATVLIEEIQQN